MQVLNTLIGRISQKNYLRCGPKFAFFEQGEIVLLPFRESGTEDFAVFLVNYDLGFEVMLLLFGRVIGTLFFWDARFWFLWHPQ